LFEELHMLLIGFQKKRHIEVKETPYMNETE